MDTSEFGTELVKIEVDHNDFNQAYQTDAVKHEPCKINILSKCERYDDRSRRSSETDLGDHYQEQNEEKLYANKPNLEYIDHSRVSDDLSMWECNPEQIKGENDIDIFYEDIKREIDEEKYSEPSELCEMCNGSFKSETGLINSKHDRYECTCQSQYESKEDMTVDLKLPSLDFTRDSGLQQHIFQDKTVCADECSNKQVSSVAPQRNSLTSLLNENLETTFHCKICSKYFISNSLLIAHLKNHTGKKSFDCKICPKSFIRKSYLNAHLKIHPREKPFQCKVCLKSFIINSKLKVHLKVHTGEKPFHCKICSKSFISKAHLKEHSKIHTGEKPYHCKICSKSFIRSGDLNVHLRIHTGEKPFHCKTCSKSFIRTVDLNLHLKIHTGEKPFQCKACSKSFMTKRRLNDHLKTHTGEKPFHCKVCLKSFIRANDLNVHSRIHTGEKPFHCQICSKSFIRNNTLKHHLKIHTR